MAAMRERPGTSTDSVVGDDDDDVDDADVIMMRMKALMVMII